jgi:acyl-CoA synthetase (AMP-forming)/AMP-acid ligase II
LLGEGLLASASSYPDKVALIVEGEPYTYSQLLEAVLCLKAALLSRGLMRGDRVAIYMDNTWPCIISVYAVLLAGGVFSVINPQTKSEKLHFLLENSDARIFLTDGHIAPVFVPVVQSISTVEHVIYSGVLKVAPKDDTGFAHFDTVISEHAPSKQFAQVIPNDLAALLYTSGSTGNPKGVMQTHQAMVFASWSLIEYLRLSSSDRIMLVLPLAFDYGLYQLLMTIKLGATLIVERSFTFPAQIYNRMLEESITVFPGVPTIFAMMAATNKKKKIVFPSVTRVTNTAAALTASLIPDLKQIFPNALIYKMYGQTECKRISYLEPELIESKPSSVGKAIPGTELFLLSPEGKAVEHGEPGILHVRGPHVMAGYWKQPETTAHMLKDGLLPGERILCTHDWFHMDDEGFLYFEGRSDDIIKTRGEKVSPLEVEKVLQEIPGIKEAAVIGVVDETLGQAVKAFIVVEEGMTYKERQLKKMCLVNLENFMVPQSIVFLAEMPKTQNGKIDKKKLR